MLSTDSSADPLLDEHFRRSLGANYQSLFKRGAEKEGAASSSLPAPKPPTPQPEPSEKSKEDETDDKKEKDPIKAFQEDMDMEGYTGKHRVLKYSI